MKSKRLVILVLVFAVLVALAYLQFRTWKSFDWRTFKQQTARINGWYVAAAVILIYITYFLRALRWKLFLRPVCHASAARLMVPTLIGFAGLALLGRPGEFSRPYLVARNENLTFSSQLAVWMVERIFDIAAFTVIALPTIFYFDKQLPLNYRGAIHDAGYVLVAIVAVLCLMAVLLRRRGEWAANTMQRWFSHFSEHFARKVCHKVRLFSEGLNTVHDTGTFLQLVAVSLLIWVAIICSYWTVLHAYPRLQPDRVAQFSSLADARTEGTDARQQHPLDVQTVSLGEVPLLTLASMVGSLVQLPAVGGGSQLATISMFRHVFNVEENLAVSCGMMLWLVTFVAVVPAGVVLARRQHLSLRALSAESELEAESEAPQPAS